MIINFAAILIDLHRIILDPIFSFPLQIPLKRFDRTIHLPVVIIQVEPSGFIRPLIGRHVPHKLLNEHLLGFDGLQGGRAGVGYDQLLEVVN